MQKTKSSEPITEAKSGFRKEQPKAEGIVKKKVQSWKRYDDDELEAVAREFCAKKGITTRIGLQDYGGLYDVLRRRGLLNRVIEPTVIYWTRMENEELLREAKKLCEKENITTRRQLAKYGSLYAILLERGLAEQVIPNSRIYWDMPEDELIRLANEHLKKQEGLTTADKVYHSKLLAALKRRKLLDKVEYERARKWKSKSDDEIVALAKEMCVKEHIENPKQLREFDQTAYLQVRDRGLLDRVFPDRVKKRNWADMKDEDIIATAKKICSEKGILKRKHLYLLDNGLYHTLGNRHLLDLVFPKDNHDLACLISAIEHFDDG